MSQEISKENTQSNQDSFDRSIDSKAHQGKAKDFKVSAKRLIGYLMRRKVQLILIFFMTVMSIAFTIAAPKILIKAIDKLGEGAMSKLKGIPNVPIDFNYIGSIIATLVILYIISSLFMFLQRYMMASVTQKTILELRKEVGEKLDKLPLKYYDNNSHGDIMSRISNDIDIISIALKENVTMLITSFLTVVGVVIMMITINPLLTLVPIGAAIAAFIYVIIIMIKTNNYFAGQRKTTGEINGHIEEMYNGHSVIKAFCREKSSIDKFDKVNEELYEVTWKAQYYSGLLAPGLYFILHLSYVLICIIGGVLTVNGKLSIGKILAFIQYSRDTFDPILEIADSISAIQAGVASAERIFEILDESEELPDIKDPKVIETPKGEIVFDRVSFGYKPEVTVIKNMNISILPGQTIAIVGPTGAGKTTFINLLMRFYELDSGKITIDGVDITEQKREDLRRLFGIVLQDTWLFNGTIKENIAYGNDRASDEEIIAAAKAAHAHHFINTLPDGYNTLLNEDASNISHGQKQLLTIARAILTNPSILILDEATSSIDTRTEINIQRAMKNLMKGRTSFVIAHRLSTIRDADLILVMKDGRIVEKGNHEELLKRDGFYTELYNNQFAVNSSFPSDFSIDVKISS